MRYIHTEHAVAGSLLDHDARVAVFDASDGRRHELELLDLMTAWQSRAAVAETLANVVARSSIQRSLEGIGEKVDTMAIVRTTSDGIRQQALLVSPNGLTQIRPWRAANYLQFAQVNGGTVMHGVDFNKDGQPARLVQEVTGPDGELDQTFSIAKHTLWGTGDDRDALKVGEVALTKRVNGNKGRPVVHASTHYSGLVFNAIRNLNTGQGAQTSGPSPHHQFYEGRLVIEGTADLTTTRTLKSAFFPLPMPSSISDCQTVVTEVLDLGPGFKAEGVDYYDDGGVSKTGARVRVPTVVREGRNVRVSCDEGCYVVPQIVSYDRVWGDLTGVLNRVPPHIVSL